ncbi:CRISPR-associated protein Cas5 [Levilactobacillus tangyuanensis]|uniref:CRISPR-associated protein Cas5 n=1 Tax=Levilactobacillus tangyuanensis TaxID=2486021 RepID=A0ABW1TLR0_9LACO
MSFRIRLTRQVRCSLALPPR